MKASSGEVLYQLGKKLCSRVDLQWSRDKFKAAFNVRVAAVVFDDEGKANIENILASMAETDLSKTVCVKY